MRDVFKYLLILLIVSFSSCDILDNNSSTISPLDGKVDFKIIESYDSYETISTPQIFVELQTEKIYPCFNYSIRTNYNVGYKSILINILGINEPAVCATALGPANSKIKLGQLSDIYEVTIKNKQFTDKYNLLISDSLIILDGEETTNTKPLINFIYRYPKNSFAYICGTTSDTSICKKFIDSLKQVIALTEFDFSDFAEIPYPALDLGYHFNTKIKYFYYDNEDEFDKIQDVMSSYKQNHFNNDDAGILIINWMNKKIRSWLL